MEELGGIQTQAQPNHHAFLEGKHQTAVAWAEARGSLGVLELMVSSKSMQMCISLHSFNVPSVAQVRGDQAPWGGETQ